MARRNVNGRFILSAGEIGAFCVCPHAWTLRTLHKVAVTPSPDFERGVQLHKAWAKRYEDAVLLGHGAKLIVLLIVMAIMIYVFS